MIIKCFKVIFVNKTTFIICNLTIGSALNEAEKYGKVDSIEDLGSIFNVKTTKYLTQSVEWN